MPKQITLEEFIKRATKKFKGRFQYDQTSWIGYDQPIKIFCPDHNEFEQVAMTHFYSTFGCHSCYQENRPRKTTDWFISEAITTHGIRYDYSKTVYTGCNDFVTIICPIHGEFQQKAIYHRGGNGCQKCGNTAALQRTTDEFIADAQKIHGTTYDYSQSIYLGIARKILIICPKHGDFWQVADDHLMGHGCIRYNQGCQDTEQFIQEATITHSGKYDYSKVDYRGSKPKVIIICPKHGEFRQIPNVHLMGGGCQKCGNSFHKKENAWLDIMEVPKENRQIRITLADGKYIVADGYDPETKTIYEFWGDPWHGNPETKKPDDIFAYTKKTYREMYEQTQDKIRRIKDSGYHLIQIWENDYDQAIDLAKRSDANLKM